jgi:hypothetical protein
VIEKPRVMHCERLGETLKVERNPTLWAATPLIGRVLRGPPTSGLGSNPPDERTGNGCSLFCENLHDAHGTVTKP